MKTLRVLCFTSRRRVLWVLAIGVMSLAGSIFFASAQDQAAGESAALPVLSASDTEALVKKEGQKVVVIGKCERSGKSRGGTNFVNFVGGDFVAVTFKSDLGPFTDGEPADLYKGKNLSITGVIEIYKDAPQIKLIDPAQVKVSDEPFKLPDPAATKAAAEDADAKKAAMVAKQAADKAAAEAAAKKAGVPTAEDGKPKPPVDPRKYFKKPTS